MQLLDWTANKSSAVGRLLLLSGLGGVLAAAIALPVVAATGILVRNTSDKFTTLSMDASGLPQRSEIFDREGNLITSVYGVDLGKGMSFTGIDRQPVAYNQISPYMVQAITAIEDDRYWTHGALDVKGTLRALMNDLRHQPVQGGSTIAHRLVDSQVASGSQGQVGVGKWQPPAASRAARTRTVRRERTRAPIGGEQRRRACGGAVRPG